MNLRHIMLKKEIEERIESLEQAAGILEEHIGKFKHMMAPKPLDFISKQIAHFKREIRIRKDFPF